MLHLFHATTDFQTEQEKLYDSFYKKVSEILVDG